MAIADAIGLLVAVEIQSASPHEVKLVEATVENRFIAKPLEHMIGDKAYDSDPPDQRLRQQYWAQLIATHKANCKRSKTQDCRVLRRHRSRWKVEHLLAWLHNFRRLTISWEYHGDNFLGLLKFG